MTWYWLQSSTMFCIIMLRDELVTRRQCECGPTQLCLSSLTITSVNLGLKFPFDQDSNLVRPSAAAEKSLIRAAQSLIQRESCVKFERIHEPHDRTDFVHIKPGHGCASTVSLYWIKSTWMLSSNLFQVGFWGGTQIIYLQKVVSATTAFQTFWLIFESQGCMDMGRILHELIHVLGFFHMHTAPTRDSYVRKQLKYH